MLIPKYTRQFKRDIKIAKRRNKDLHLLENVMQQIMEEKQLSLKLKDHSLGGNWKGYRELHLEPDWLLIYKISRLNNVLPLTGIVEFVRTGTHSDLF